MSYYMDEDSGSVYTKKEFISEWRIWMKGYVPGDEEYESLEDSFSQLNPVRRTKTKAEKDEYGDWMEWG